MDDGATARFPGLLILSAATLDHENPLIKDQKPLAMGDSLYIP